MNDKRLFTLYGEPVGKGRPRGYRQGEHVRFYTPEKTAAYETAVALAYKVQCKGRFEKGVPVYMIIKAFFKPPLRTSKVNLEKMRTGLIRPLKKPDLDNVVKAVADALNGIAYYDDSQIVSLRIEKYYSKQPRIEVEIGSTYDLR